MEGTGAAASPPTAGGTRDSAPGAIMKKFSAHCLLFPTFLSLGLLGFLFSSVGVTLPELRSAFDLTVDKAGLISAAVQFGYAAFCFISGILSDLFGKKRILVLGCLLYGSCGLLAGAPASFAGTMIVFTGLGVGSGLIFTSSNSLVVALSPEKRDRYLNLHHLVFAIASFASPLVCSRLLLAGREWSTVYRGLGFAALAIGALFAAVLVAGDRVIEFRPRAAPAFGTLARQYRDVFRDKLFLTLLASGLLSVGVQFAIIYLLVLFLTQARGVPLGTASDALSIYFVFLAGGRYFCAKLVHKIAPERIVVFLMMALTAALCLGLATDGLPSLAVFSLTGLACSGLMPNMLSLASRILPEGVRGAALGVFSMCGGLGGMGVTYATTLLAARMGLESGFRLLVAASAVSIILFIIFIRMMHRRIRPRMAGANKK